MAYPPPIAKKERKVLEVIARGHPGRTMSVQGTWGSGTINALEWEEIEKASGVPSEKFGGCVAHLVAGDLIDSDTKQPGLWGRLSSMEEQYFFWATQYGRRLLAEQSEADTPEAIIPPTRAAATGSDIDDAVRIYENSFSSMPYVKPEEVKWAERILDEDIRSEVKGAALELEEMWAAFKGMFGHGGPARGEREAAVRDPVVKCSAVRAYRATDEQRRRRGFGPSPKPEAWPTHYNNGQVGLDPAPWEPPASYTTQTRNRSG